MNVQINGKLPLQTDILKAIELNIPYFIKEYEERYKQIGIIYKRRYVGTWAFDGKFDVSINKQGNTMFIKIIQNKEKLK